MRTCNRVLAAAGSLPIAVLALALSACGPAVIDPPQPEIMYRLVGKPAGEGPFPALVILHGCAGVGKNHHLWMKRVNDWGYVGLIVDSFPPRNVSNKCASPNRGRGKYDDRVADAYGALLHLQSLSYVDPDRIALIGFSHGGGTALRVVSAATPARFAIGPEVRFKAAVAYYPYCEAFAPFYAPLLILAGAQDEWTPAQRCLSLLEGSQADGERTAIEVYPDATHAFDYVGLDTTYQGHRLVYNPVAAEDSFQRVEAFFDAYLE